MGGVCVYITFFWSLQKLLIQHNFEQYKEKIRIYRKKTIGNLRTYYKIHQVKIKISSAKKQQTELKTDLTSKFKKK